MNDFRAVASTVMLLLAASAVPLSVTEGHRFQSPSKTDSSADQVDPAQPLLSSPGTESSLTRESAQQALDALYKGDYRQAFIEKRPELFLRHIAPDFHSTLVDGSVFDEKALRQFFPKQFANMIRTHEHNVTIEGVAVTKDGVIVAVVTLNTLIEYRGAAGHRYFVLNIGTYRDHFVRSSSGILMETDGDHQLRSQTITWPEP